MQLLSISVKIRCVAWTLSILKLIVNFAPSIYIKPKKSEKVKRSPWQLLPSNKRETKSKCEAALLCFPIPFLCHSENKEIVWRFDQEDDHQRKYVDGVYFRWEVVQEAVRHWLHKREMFHKCETGW